MTDILKNDNILMKMEEYIIQMNTKVLQNYTKNNFQMNLLMKKMNNLLFLCHNFFKYNISIIKC